MKAPEQRPVQFVIDDGPTFFADEISITNNDQKFFFDFKNQSPRIDVRANDALPIAVKHSVVLMDPGLAKVFGKLLMEHVERFEKDHGAIPDPKMQAQVGTMTVSKTEERPGYFG